MNDFQKLYEFGPAWEVTKIVINRTGPNRALSFIVLFKKKETKIELQFDRPDDTDYIVDLIDAETVIISREIDSQKEYGSIRIEFFDETWTEFHCDAVTPLKAQPDRPEKPSETQPSNPSCTTFPTT